MFHWNEVLTRWLPGCNKVISRLHWNLNEMLSLRVLCHWSLWWTNRHFQWEILGESYEIISKCSSCTLTTISIKWTKDVWWYWAVPWNSSYISNLSTLGWVFLITNTNDSSALSCRGEGDVHLKQLKMKQMIKYFFYAGHVQYARYITQCLIEMRAHAKDNAVLVCSHQDGCWNTVSSDQFGEQTAICIGKWGIKRHDTVCWFGKWVIQRLPNHMYSFWSTGQYLLRFRIWLFITESA